MTTLSEEALASMIDNARSYIGANGYDPAPEDVIAICEELLALRRAPQTPMVGAEPMEAWTWQLALNSHGLSGPHFSAEKPVFSPSDAAMVRNLRPLYAAPPVGAEPMEAVATGFKLVPVEPTEGMLQAGLRELQDNLGDMSVIVRDPLLTYRAMLAVAPASPLDRASVTVKARDAAIDDCALIAKYGMERSERDYRTKSPDSHSYRMAEEIYECIIALKASP